MRVFNFVFVSIFFISCSSSSTVEKDVKSKSSTVETNVNSYNSDIAVVKQTNANIEVQTDANNYTHQQSTLT